MVSKAAIIGSGNIGTDLMFKIMRLSDEIEFVIMVGIDPDSDGLARAESLGFEATAEGVDGLMASARFDEIDIVFDATSAGAHKQNASKLAPFGKQLIDLTPAALGPYVVPSVNLEQNIDALDINMVTCGGQATIPIVAAIGSISAVHYAEIVASIASASAGPGTRANIDEFTETTSTAIEVVGGAARGKAIIVLNPAEPPMIMRDTVHVVIDHADAHAREAITDVVEARVAEIAGYVPGYRLKQEVQFLNEGPELDLMIPEGRRSSAYTQVTVFLEVKGAAMYLPEYAGNLDIMTSAALQTAENLVRQRTKEATA